MAFFSHYSHQVSSQFVQVFLTSVSKCYLFSASVRSIQIKLQQCCGTQSVLIKCGVQCGSNMLSLTYKVKIDYLACRFYFHNSDHVGSQENLPFVFLLVTRLANASGQLDNCKKHFSGVKSQWENETNKLKRFIYLWLELKDAIKRFRGTGSNRYLVTLPQDLSGILSKKYQVEVVCMLFACLSLFQTKIFHFPFPTLSSLT